MEVMESIAVEIGVDLNPLRKGMQEASRFAMSSADAVGSSYGLGFSRPILNAIGALNDFKAGLVEIGQIAYNSSGVKIAGDYQTLQVGLTGVIGDAKEAKRVFKELDNLGGTTSFDTAGLIGYSRQLLAVGVSTRNVSKDIGAMADAVSTVAGNTFDLGRLAENLGQIRSTPGNPELTDLKQLTRMGLNIDKIVGAAQGKELPTGGGVRALQGMKGEQAYNTIITGFQKTYGGNAQTMADSTLQGVAANAGEAISKIMLPTGDALIPVFTKASGVIRDGASALEKFNEGTGGSAGLIGIIGVATVGVRVFGGGIRETVTAARTAATAVTTLAVAAERLAGAADGAAISVGNSTAAENRRSGGVAGIGGEMVGYIFPAIGEGLAGWQSSRMSDSAEEAIKKGDRDKAIHDEVDARRLRALAQGAGYWGTIGATAGGIVGGLLIPGLGAIPGAAIGGAAGTLLGGGIAADMERTKANREVPADVDAAMKRNTDAIEKNTRELQKVSLSAFGGGDRLRGGLRSLEMEYAVQRALVTKIG